MRRNRCFLWVCVLIRQVHEHLRAGLAKEVPAGSPFLCRKALYGKYCSFPSPKCSDIHSTHHWAHLRAIAKFGFTSAWLCSSVPEYRILCQKLLTGPLDWTIKFQVSGIRSILSEKQSPEVMVQIGPL